MSVDVDLVVNELPRLRRYLFCLSGSVKAADDALLVLQILVKRPSLFSISRSRVNLYKATHHLVDGELDLPHSPATSNELLDGILRLPFAERKALLLRLVAEFKAEEICSILDLEAGEYEALQERALRWLNNSGSVVSDRPARMKFSAAPRGFYHSRHFASLNALPGNFETPAAENWLLDNLGPPIGTGRILVVEDQYFLARDISVAVRKAGYDCVGPVAAIDAALELARSEPLQGAILDIKLRASYVWPVAECLLDRGIPFVFCTAYGSSTPLPEHYATVPCLEKPVSQQDLIKGLQNAITP